MVDVIVMCAFIFMSRVAFIEVSGFSSGDDVSLDGGI